MSGLADITIELLTARPWLVSIAFALLVAGAIYLYHRTNPPLPRHWKVLLGTLRLAVLVALFAALFEPVISYTREFERPRRIALLLDHSLSMAKEESGKSRLARLDSLLSSQSLAGVRSRSDVTPYYLGGNLVSSHDRVDGDRTALGEALYQLEQRELAEPSDYWLLFSDGRSNAGRDPAEAVRNVPTPIIAVDMAGGIGRFDVALSDITFNPIVFSGQKTEISVKLTWQDALNRAVRIELRDSTEVLAGSRLAITQEVGRGEITLEYSPAEPGVKILEVFIPPTEGEETVDNNRRSFAVKVLKSRLAVLLVTSAPDYEVGFFKRFLEQSGRYEIDLNVTGQNAGSLAGRFPSQQTEINRYDLVVLHDPDPRLLGAYQDIFKSYLEDRGGAIWVLMGKQFARRGPVAWFNELLPFFQSDARARRHVQFHAAPAEGNLFHPAVRLAESQSAIREVWAQLPPFQSLVPCNQVHADAVVLASAVLPGQGDRGLPVMGYRRHGPGRVFGCAALPFWTWGFVTLGFGEDNSSYGKFIEGVVSWLTVKDDIDPIRSAPQKKVFARGETVPFDGFAFDVGFRPIPGVAGTVRLEKTGGADTVVAELNNLGDGKYRAEFYHLPPGSYHYVGTFDKDEQLLRQSEGDILVESFSLEEFDQSGNPAVLTSLARLSGGDYFTYAEFDRALESVETAPVKVSQAGELLMWNKLWLMFIMVGALSVEWLLRKVLQLV